MTYQISQIFYLQNDWFWINYNWLFLRKKDAYNGTKLLKKYKKYWCVQSKTI